MDKKRFIALAASVCLMMIFACSHEYQGVLIPMQDVNTGKWGYADTLGKIVIAFQWDNVRTFNDSLAVVERNGKYGYIDRKGTEVIPIKYDIAEDHSDNRAI